MIEVTVAYPAGQGHTFNMDYYLKTHIPLFQKRMSAAMKTIRVSTRNWRQYAEVARGLRGYGARHLRLR
jgi:hypothetical protein